MSRTLRTTYVLLSEILQRNVTYNNGLFQSWVISAHRIGAHVRAYATLNNLNSNDNSSVHSYSTRVDNFEKVGSKWVLTLRHLKRLEEPDRLKVTYWKEEFDAVVVGSGPYNSPHVPEIDGLLQWSKVVDPSTPSGFSVYHSRVYRNPEHYAGKVGHKISLPYSSC